MAKKTAAYRRKRRTREHILADLSIHHVEGHVLRCGFTIERVVHDYGIDLLLYTYDELGEVENGEIRLQVKATEAIKTRSRRPVIPWRLEQRDVRFWLNELMPVVLVVYDESEQKAYWLHLQAHFANRPQWRFGQTVTVHIPTDNVLSGAAVRMFRKFRQQVLAQLQEEVHNDE